MSRTSQYIGQAQDEYEELVGARKRIAELEATITMSEARFDEMKSAYDAQAARIAELEAENARLREKYETLYQAALGFVNTDGTLYGKSEQDAYSKLAEIVVTTALGGAK